MRWYNAIVAGAIVSGVVVLIYAVAGGPPEAYLSILSAEVSSPGWGQQWVGKGEQT